MIFENGGKLFLVGVLHQGIERCFGYRIECGVSRREYGERSLGFQRIDQASLLHGGDKGGIFRGIYSVLYDVFIPHYRMAADSGITHAASHRHRPG